MNNDKRYNRFINNGHYLDTESTYLNEGEDFLSIFESSINFKFNRIHTWSSIKRIKLNPSSERVKYFLSKVNDA